MLIPVALGIALTQANQNEVTVYNQGFALIKEVRQISLQAGRQNLAIEDVAQQIETNSVGIKCLGNPNALEVLEQNYQYDLISPMAILNKAIGKTIRLSRILPNGAKETIEGTMLSAPSGIGADMVYQGMVLRTSDGRILLNPAGELEVTSIPDGLISRPTLLWDLFAPTAGSQTIELSYLTRGMSWTADYVLTLDGSGTGDIKGWVTMTNQSGANFADAKLKLLAGDVQRVAPRGAPGIIGGGREALSKMVDAGFQEESLFEYHLYTLQRPATIRNNETKQLSLLEAKGVTVTKKLVVDSMLNFGMYYPSEGEVGTGIMKPQVRLEFLNKTDNKLGMPLPAGNFKVYQRDKSGSVQMLGEDRIIHTPRDEKVSLVVGRSFDVVAERKRTNFRRLSPNSFEESFEIEVRNRKQEADSVVVLERHYGDWRVSETSQKWDKLDANTMQYVVALKAGESKKITYTVVTKW
ncbi:MAG: hypothetical protein HZC36_13175 [Armatimonadetes bacterium]|nr:hypothetical protein [Armatimonadota bacterium]